MKNKFNRVVYIIISVMALLGWLISPFTSQGWQHGFLVTFGMFGLMAIYDSLKPSRQRSYVLGSIVILFVVWIGMFIQWLLQ